jgi:GT2 family glycosyltransferase
VVFDPTEMPVATVIVLAWRLTDELLDALEGLAGGSRHNDFEVVVVLNGADESVRAAVFGQVEGATVIDTPVNLGFAAGCNLAASRARGQLLVFLNDDATPAPTWLDSLIESARVHRDAGAISSRVHFPDGRLQEAGARILADPAGIAIGFGADVVPSELTKPRLVDYGGAEALLVRREPFVEVGGFDQAYGPAYFEDADLCLRLRAAGWNILYEPSAVVTHHQSLSTKENLEWRTFTYEQSKALFSRHWRQLLPNAARVDDPPAVLMPVPRGHGLRHLDLAQQVATATTEVAALERQHIQEFADWLRDQLRRVSARAESAESGRKELEAMNAAQQRELAALENAPVRALLAWRLGFWLRAHSRVHSILIALRPHRQ